MALDEADIMAPARLLPALRAAREAYLRAWRDYERDLGRVRDAAERLLALQANWLHAYHDCTDAGVHPSVADVPR